MDEKNAAREKCSEQLRRLLEEVAKVSSDMKEVMPVNEREIYPQGL